LEKDIRKNGKFTWKSTGRTIKNYDVHRLSHRNWAIPNSPTQMVNKGGVVGGLWCFESKNLEGWWGQDFERSFF